MKIAAFGEMGYRRKSKDAAMFESIAGLTAVVLFLFIFSPGFRIAAVLAAVIFVIWLVYKIVKSESPSPTFRTFTYDPYQADESIRKKQPAVFVEELKKDHQNPKLTISEKLRKIDWYQFEKLIELIYQHRGYAVKRLGGANADGGVDLIIGSSAEKFVVQCKHWRKWTVGVRHIREFLGTLTDSKIPKGIFITLVGYSGDAKQLADKHGIQILNESDLIEMLKESGLIYSQEISKLFSDERKFCPKCEEEMVLRTARVKGNKFWGCSNYPRCRFILNLET
jgi:restriction system protein